MGNFVLPENITSTQEVVSNNASGESAANFEDMFGPRRDSLYIVVPITIIYVIIFLTGLIGNISTCVVISRNKSMHTATNYYLFSLAISDLVLLLSGLPQEMHSIWRRYPYIYGQTFCVLRAILAETSANATVLTITAFTVERYVAICHPFLSHTMSKLSRAIKLILVIWVIAVLCATPQALQLEVYEIKKGNPDSKVCMPAKVLIEHGFTISTVLFFILPMTIITVLYALIGLRLRSSAVLKNSVSVNERVGLGHKHSRSCRHHGQSSRRVVKMLVAVVVAFFICWAPFHVQRLVATYNNDGKNETKRKIYEIVTYISGILYYISATVNPVLYNIMSNKFREAFKETFARCCKLGQFKHDRPQRSYSVLSRSVQRGVDSTTDSGRDEPSIHTTLTHKSSLDSFNGMHTAKRCCSRTRMSDRYNVTEMDFHRQSAQSTWYCKDRCLANSSICHPSPSSDANHVKHITVYVKNSEPRFNFWHLFRCITRQSLQNGSFRHSPTREPSIILLELEQNNKVDDLSMSICDISNCSLKDIENMALEDELTTYMKEIKNRERCN